MNRETPKSLPPEINSREFEEASKVLEALAAGFDEQSPEHIAIELAARSMLFAFQEGVSAQFKVFLERGGAGLSEEQKARLRGLGLEG